MPLTKIKLPKKTNTQTNSYTGAAGEVTIDTDKQVIVVHDGSTAGGLSLASEARVNAAFTAANAASSYANSAYAAANTKLDSSGGTISGNITITGNILPTTANTYYLGSEAAPFHSLFVGPGSISIGGLVLSNSNGSLGVTSPTGPSLDFTAISSTANAAYTQANTAIANAADTENLAVTSGSYANSAYLQANTANTTATSAGIYANAAFAAANSAGGGVDTWVRNAANAASSYANSAYTQANTANTNAATADQRAVTSGDFANSAYTAANTGATNALSAGSYANGAFASANTKYSSSGGMISGDVTVTGNLIVTGNVFSVEATNLSVEDNMIYLNANNTVTNPDLGFAGNYNDGTYHHAGLFRDATDGTWKFFYNYQPEPDASPYIDTTHSSFRIANLTANLITDVATIRGYDPINHTNLAYTHANAAFTAANSASGGGGVTSFSAGVLGFTPSTATTGAIVLTGILATANGGTNVSTSTGSGSNVLNTSPTLASPTINGGYTEQVFAISGATPALDEANGSIQTWTLPSNSTPTSSLGTGQAITLMITASSYTITWPSVTWKTGSGTAPTLNTGAGVTAIQLWNVGGVLYGARVGNN